MVLDSPGNHVDCWGQGDYLICFCTGKKEYRVLLVSVKNYTRLNLFLTQMAWKSLSVLITERSNYKIISAELENELVDGISFFYRT